MRRSYGFLVFGVLRLCIGHRLAVHPSVMPLPTVSIVIASGAGSDFLFHCLDSLRDQAAAERAEVIVVDRCGEPHVIELAAPAGHHPSVPELRMLGLKRATGDIVAIIEEHCLAPAHWLRTIRESTTASATGWSIFPNITTTCLPGGGSLRRILHDRALS